jgi:hypothetical protein
VSGRDLLPTMETTLHRQLKQYFAGPDARLEVKLGRYRIDIVDGQRLIEVQHSGLASLRTKVSHLLKDHEVEVIKPLIARRRLIRVEHPDSEEVVSVRWSPRRATPLDLFHELIYFLPVFPHPRLTLRIPLIEIEEVRYPWERRNRRRGQFRISDQRLLNVLSENVYRTPADLTGLLPAQLQASFGTRDLAAGLKIDRWVAQRIAWCLRTCGALEVCGKTGNAIQYRLAAPGNGRTRTSQTRTKAKTKARGRRSRAG